MQGFPGAYRHRGASESEIRSITRAVRWASNLGLNSIDLSVMTSGQLETMLKRRADIRALCRDNRVTIDHLYSAFLSPLIFAGDSVNLVRLWDNLASLAGAIDASTIEMLSPSVPGVTDAKLGRRTSRTRPGRAPSWNRLWSRYVSVMKRNTRLAERHNLKLAVEPRPNEMLHDTDSVLRLFDSIDSPHLGAVFDASHIQIVRERPSLSIMKLGKRIFSVHLSDNDGVTEWHWAPGQGQIDWEPIFISLREAGYDGILSLDVSGIDVEQEVIDGKQYVEELLSEMNVTYNSEKAVVDS